jgi:hypothetical protein
MDNPDITRDIARLEKKLDAILLHLGIGQTPTRPRRDIEAQADRVVVELSRHKKGKKT